MNEVVIGLLGWLCGTLGLGRRHCYGIELPVVRLGRDGGGGGGGDVFAVAE